VEFRVVRITVQSAPVGGLGIDGSPVRLVEIAEIGQHLHIVWNQHRAAFEGCQYRGLALRRPISDAQAFFARSPPLDPVDVDGKGPPENDYDSEEVRDGSARRQGLAQE